MNIPLAAFVIYLGTWIISCTILLAVGQFNVIILTSGIASVIIGTIILALARSNYRRLAATNNSQKEVQS